jgi:predicted metal-dependent HD superfamily phosphohydrolase
MQLEKAEQFIIDFLKNNLSASLHYHDLSHTLGVRESAMLLAKAEGISSPEELVILQTAALYHDCGFANVYDDHEEEGCRLTREILPQFGYNDQQIDIICHLIMKTKLPQEPETHLEQILCDADLDHLGRADFDYISKKLHEEWIAIGRHLTEKEWNEIQVKFLSNHEYWTASARKRSDDLKQKHLQSLLDLVR